MAQKTPAKPLEHKVVAKRSRIPAEGKAGNAVVSLLDISLDEVKGSRIIHEAGIRIVAECGPNGLDRRRGRDLIPTTRLTLKDIDRKLLAQEIKGHRPSGQPTTFKPKLAKHTHQLPPAKGEHVDRGGTIFGNDDRYLFDDHSFPWRTTGKVVRSVSGDPVPSSARVMS